MVCVKDIIKLDKHAIFYTYQCIFNAQDEVYDSITRSKMISEIFSFYQEEPSRMIELFTPEEMNALKKYQKNSDYNIINEYRVFRKFLILSYNDELKYEMVDELEATIDAALKLYKDNKYKYDRAKKDVYLAVGLLVSYGALRVKELKELLSANDTSFDTLDSLYFKRYVKKEGSVYSLRDCKAIDYFSKKILKTHGKTFRTVYSKNALVNRGKYMFDIDDKNYIIAMKSEKISKYINAYDTSIIDFVGCDRIDLLPNLEWYDLSDQDYWDFGCLLDSMPRFFLTDNDKSIVSKETVDLFYSVFNDYLKFLGRKKGHNIILQDDKIDSERAYEILEEAIQNNETFYDDFARNSLIDDAKKEMLNSILSGKIGLFAVYKHENDGTIFMDENSRLYKVKGLITPIKRLNGFDNTPLFARTLIFEYHNEWIYCGLIQHFAIQMGPNVKKKLKEEYERLTCDSKLTN